MKTLAIIVDTIGQIVKWTIIVLAFIAVVKCGPSALAGLGVL